MKQNPDFAKYLSNFLMKYLRGTLNVSKNTIASYRDSFKLFLLFMEEEKKTDLLEKGAIVQRDYETFAVAPHLPGGICDPATLRKITISP